MTDQLELIQPDDWHLHLRDGDALASLVPATAAQMGRAIVMPNLKPPVTTTGQAVAYRDRILAHRPAGSTFEPLMTLYLTDTTPVSEVEKAKASGYVHAFKLYPAGATTNSDSGVTDLAKVHGVLEAMERHGVVLCIHGEVTDPDVDIFDRERVFVDRTLGPLLAQHPGLKVVLEHITTREAAQFVAEGPERLGATITAHHLLVNRNAMLAGGIRPHYYCLPILKREADRGALLEAATSGCPKFFLGTDSAPHAVHTKEADCGCAGCFTAPTALELYAEAFDGAGALEQLEGFASLHGPAFYGLLPNATKVRLARRASTIPREWALGATTVQPWRGGTSTPWAWVP
jgi:dihydroorotase